MPLITRFLDSTRRLVDRVREIRDDPPEGLGRTPGPKAILYSLNRDEALKEEGLRLPRSTRTIHRILHENGRIASRLPRLTDPLERPEPMEHWQLDFKDASTVPADLHGKRQHVVETLNIIDKGTSILVDHHVRSDFTAETALEALAQTFASHGFPASITLDRDTRWVGAPQGSDFPAALVRFCHCLGVVVLICDPHHPQPAWVCGKISSHAQSGVPLTVSSQNVGGSSPGDRSVCHPLQLAATASRDSLWQSTSSRGFS